MAHKIPTGVAESNRADDLPQGMPLLPRSVDLIAEISRVQLEWWGTAAKLAWLEATVLQSEAQRTKRRQVLLLADLRKTLAELLFSWPLAMLPASPGAKVVGRISFGRHHGDGAERRTRAVVISFPDRRLA